MYAICIEASHQRGLGHLYRAVNLIRHLRAQRIDCKVILNEHAVSLDILRREGVEFLIRPVCAPDQDWEEAIFARFPVRMWINDRLDTDLEHAVRIKRRGVPLVTFDDRGGGAALADLHIAALAFDRSELLPGRRVLQGVEYLILNPDIERYRRRRERLESIVVTLGGTDTYGVTVGVVESLARLGKTATVVLGPGFEHRAQLDRVLVPGFVLKSNVASLSQEFAVHDLAITGGGITPFEANAGGLPCLTIASETFEVGPCRFLAAMNSSVYLGRRSEIDPRKMGAALSEANIATMSAAGLAGIGFDGAKTVVAELMRL